MKINKFFGLQIALCLTAHLAVFCAISTAQESTTPNRAKQNRQLLMLGMNRTEVAGLLGSPLERIELEAARKERWQYESFQLIFSEGNLGQLIDGSIRQESKRPSSKATGRHATTTNAMHGSLRAKGTGRKPGQSQGRLLRMDSFLKAIPSEKEDPKQASELSRSFFGREAATNQTPEQQLMGQEVLREIQARMAETFAGSQPDN
jgi:hypothetical protein